MWRPALLTRIWTRSVTASRQPGAKRELPASGARTFSTMRKTRSWTMESRFLIWLGKLAQPSTHGPKTAKHRFESWFRTTYGQMGDSMSDSTNYWIYLKKFQALARRLSPRRVGRLWRFKLAPRVGFEPTAIRLTVECSTAELSGSDPASAWQVAPIAAGFAEWQGSGNPLASKNG